MLCSADSRPARKEHSNVAKELNVGFKGVGATEAKRQALQRLEMAIVTGTPCCCLIFLLLISSAAPAIAIGEHVPTEFSEMTRTDPPDSWLDESECVEHDQCSEGKFCKWAW